MGMLHDFKKAKTPSKEEISFAAIPRF